jgi:hypothetical protein
VCTRLPKLAEHDMRGGSAAVAVLAILASGCGKAATLRHSLRRHPSRFPLRSACLNCICVSAAAEPLG